MAKGLVLLPALAILWFPGCAVFTRFAFRSCLDLAIGYDSLWSIFLMPSVLLNKFSCSEGHDYLQNTSSRGSWSRTVV